MLEMRDKIKDFEMKLTAANESTDNQISKLQEEILQKDKEIEAQKLKSKLTKQQKEALRFFQDQFLGNNTFIIFRK